ncbi:RNA-binding protein 42 [Anthonomus grandis grandis]|uniref:RNA-binding protein 42 n=1 Tax=Anthonomus grandis grandis TaxID=2921223 RepID=UPI002165A63F|nr:RNA-binding protein 42 [Anthonomus grandis grandis]
MDRFRQMEDEMSRFEAEISGQSLMGGFVGPAFIPGFGNIPPPPQPPLLIPHQVGKKVFPSQSIISSAPSVVTAKPTVYQAPPQRARPQPAAPTAAPTTAASQSAVDFLALQSEVEKKLKKLKNEKISAEIAISQGKASSALQSFGPEEHKRKGSKNRKLLRIAGGQTWEDSSLADWPDDDFRIFCGDLGNDVTDELLTRTFNKFPSFQRAKVIRDKRTNKSKGYGFVSFKEPSDFTKAMKEMNGRYVGSRPIKLRKSTWRSRCIDVVKKKEKEKAALINLLTSGGGK